jgi:hypothetical protein
MNKNVKSCRELRVKCNSLSAEEREKNLKKGVKMIGDSYSWSQASKKLAQKAEKSGIDLYLNKEDKKSKTRYCYIVLCNREPIVYSVYLSKTAAVEYAKYLFEYRKQKAQEQGFEFGFYHYDDFSKNRKKENDFDKREKTIFSTCLKIGGDKTDFGFNRCWIKVMRKPLLTGFEK